MLDTLRVLPLLLFFGTGLLGQATPAPNRLAWMAVFPEPLPDGESCLGVEYTNQFLRPSSEVSPDGRTFARLDGEEWQLTSDLATTLGPGRLNLRLRVVSRSGGFLDGFFQDYHKALGLRNGGRDAVANGRMAYHLERDGVVVGDLRTPRFQVMDPDVAYVVTFGEARSGSRFGGSLQIPAGTRKDFSGSGGWEGLLGAAGWHRAGNWTIHGQAEWVFLQVPGTSPYRAVLDSRSFQRAWLGGGWQGTGDGFWSGLGLDVSLAYSTTPYATGISRIDGPGVQQHWVLSHAALPQWRLGVSEEAGSWATPDITVFVSRRY